MHKIDAPSGTAKTLLNTYNNNNNNNFIELNDIQSIREGDIIGEHELILEGKDETIKISHIANSRTLFASGCIKMLEKLFFEIDIKKYSNGLFDYDTVMN